ncbi:MAG: hypothetical protein KA354_09650 [Phycisphaerae bacterium]|nr:hypothetical protein [Phycisphaerae bacterium]
MRIRRLPYKVLASERARVVFCRAGLRQLIITLGKCCPHSGELVDLPFRGLT